MGSEEKWYRVKEVAARYGVSCDTIKRRIKAGALKAMKLPRVSPKRKRCYVVWLIPGSALDNFERGNMV